MCEGAVCVRGAACAKVAAFCSYDFFFKAIIVNFSEILRPLSSVMYVVDQLHHLVSLRPSSPHNLSTSSGTSSFPVTFLSSISLISFPFYCA
jgi:hypothetical protein